MIPLTEIKLAHYYYMFHNLNKKINKLIKNKKTPLGLLLLFIFSRIFFINEGKVFFDSNEYLLLFALPDLFSALIGGHFPFHEGYILLFWPVYQITQYFSANPAYWVIIGQIILATVTVFSYYKVVSFISNTKVALLSTIIISLTPLFWITNVTITLEVSYLCSFFLSFYMLTLYLSKNKTVYLTLSILLFTYSFITYSAVVLWLPLYMLVVFFKKKREFIKIGMFMMFSLVFFLLLRILVLSEILHKSPLFTFHHLYTSNATDAGHFQGNLKGLLVLIRNFIPPIRGHTSLVFFLGLVSLLWSFRRNKQVFFYGLVWVLPLLYMNQWWDSLLMGRYSLITGFGLAFLVGYFINTYRTYLLPILIYLCIISLPALSLLKTDVPYVKEAEFAKTLPKNGLLIVSHYALPVLEKCCLIKIIAVNDPSVGTQMIETRINEYLQNKKPVFVSTSAISDPYGLYQGPYLHPLSLSYAHKFELNPLLTNYTLQEYKIINEKDHTIIYKIASSENSSYPKVKNLKYSYRRIDYYDPFWRIVKFFEDAILHQPIDKTLLGK